MKLKKTICIFLCFTFLIILPCNEVNAWNSTDHTNRLKQIVTKVLSKNCNFSSKELELLYKCAVLPDDSSKVYDSNVAHGRHNYLITVGYLYELSVAYLSNQNKVVDLDFMNQFLKGCNYIPEGNRDNLKKLNIVLNQLLTNKVCYTNDNYELSNRKKSIKVLGYMMHVIGDIYAHRTLVPVSSVDYSGMKNPAFHFAKDDFGGSTEKFNIMKSIISENQNKDLYSASSGNPVGVAFYDLNKWGNNKYEFETKYSAELLKSISNDLAARKYEDNPDFFSKRFDATYTASRRFLVEFNGFLGNHSAGSKDIPSIRLQDSIKKLEAYRSAYKDNNYRLQNYDYYMKEIENI